MGSEVLVVVAVLLVLSILGVVVACMSNEYKSTRDKCWIAIFGFLIGVFLMLLLYEEFIGCQPNALDVYRGLTELEVTSINNVPQDTVVVWKNIK